MRVDEYRNKLEKEISKAHCPSISITQAHVFTAVTVVVAAVVLCYCVVVAVLVVG